MKSLVCSCEVDDRFSVNGQCNIAKAIGDLVAVKVFCSRCARAGGSLHLFPGAAPPGYKHVGPMGLSAFDRRSMLSLVESCEGDGCCVNELNEMLRRR